jgi:hypothetical protein
MTDPKQKATAEEKAVKKTVDQSATTNSAADAHKEAQKDIDQDADLSIHSPNDDLDEGETAGLGEDKTDLV